MKNRRVLISHGALLALIWIPAISRADTVLDWNAIMQSTVSSQTPFPQARFAAITQLAVFEAVNAITRDYQPYLGTITAPANASVDAAAATAAHDVLKNYFPPGAAMLDAALATSLATIPNSPAKMAGIAVGQSAAAAMISSASFGCAPNLPDRGQSLPTLGASMRRYSLASGLTSATLRSSSTLSTTNHSTPRCAA